MCCFEATMEYRTRPLAATPTTPMTKTTKPTPGDDDVVTLLPVILLPVIWSKTSTGVLSVGSSNVESCPVLMLLLINNTPISVAGVCSLFGLVSNTSHSYNIHDIQIDAASLN